MVVDRERVRALLAEGRSRAEVAEKVGCHPATVWRIAREPEPQPSSSTSPRQAPRAAESAPPRSGGDAGLDRVRDLRRETARLRAELEFREAERTLADYERRACDEDERELARADREAQQKREDERHRQELHADAIQREQQARNEQAQREVASVVEQMRRDSERFEREAQHRHERAVRTDAAHARLRERERRLTGPAGTWWNCKRCGEEFLAEGLPESCSRCGGVLRRRA